EFALIAAILVAMILGIVEFGRLWAVQGSMAQAARDAARTYAITEDPATADPTFRDTFSWLKPGTESALTVTPSGHGTPGDPGCRRTVSATYTMDSLTGFFGEDWTITSEGSMRYNG